MNRLLSLLLIILMAAAGLIQASERPGLTGALRTEHFIVHYRPGMQSTASVVAEVGETWISELSGRLDAKQYLDPPIPLFIYRDQGDYRKATGQDRPGMVLGRASSLGYVELDASGIFAPTGRIAGHEITHVLIFRILGDRADTFPLWANEGTAKFMTDDWSQADQDNLLDAVVSGSLIPLDDISHHFPEGQDESLAYAEGTSAIKFFVGKYGERSLARLIHETGITGSFDEAMKKVTGQSARQFEASWRASLEGGLGVAKLMRYGRLIAAFGWPLLFLAAYLAFRRRRRRAIERYDREEWEEANWRDWGGR